MTARVVIPPSRNPVLRGNEHFQDWRRFHERTAEQINTTAAQSDTDHTTLSTLSPYADLIGSYVLGCSITASDNGTNATITITTHYRAYFSGAVSVTGATLTADYDTDIWVYYVDATRAGGTVTYLGATFYGDAFVTSTHPDRHFVGSIHTPASGGPNTAGKPCRPPGYNEP